MSDDRIDDAARRIREKLDAARKEAENRARLAGTASALDEGLRSAWNALASYIHERSTSFNTTAGEQILYVEKSHDSILVRAAVRGHTHTLKLHFRESAIFREDADSIPVPRLGLRQTRVMSRFLRLAVRFPARQRGRPESLQT
jgi:hypothetical protein